MGGGRHNDAAADALLLASTCEPSRSGVFYTDSHHICVHTCQKHDAGILRQLAYVCWYQLLCFQGGY